MNRYLILLLTVISLFLILSCSSKSSVVPTVIPEEESIVEETEQPVEQEVVKEKKAEVKLVFNDINFEYDKSYIQPQFRDVLAKYAKYLMDNPNINLLIEGHCDERGTIEYNLSLGDRRANMVKNYFVSYGINSDRIRTISYGKEKPLDPEHNEKAWAVNRRAKFLIK